MRLRIRHTLAWLLPFLALAAALVGEGTRAAAERNFAFLEVDLLEAGRSGRPWLIYALLGNAYRAQEWVTARALIEQCRALSGASPRLYGLYVERIAYHQTHPPGEGWDGVFRPVQT